MTGRGTTRLQVRLTTDEDDNAIRAEASSTTRAGRDSATRQRVLTLAQRAPAVSKTRRWRPW